MPVTCDAGFNLDSLAASHGPGDPPVQGPSPNHDDDSDHRLSSSHESSFGIPVRVRRRLNFTGDQPSEIDTVTILLLRPR